MNKRLLTCLAIAIFTLPAIAQDGDKLFLRVQYSVSGLEYLDRQPYTDLFNLDMGQTNSVFYSYIQYCRDSVENSLKAQGLTGMAVKFALSEKGYRQGKKEILIKNEKEKKFYLYNQIGTFFCFTKVPVLNVDWKISSDTSTIFGYKCYKARAFFKGRDWIVWFTTDIPINKGPWEISGLPGIVLRAFDAENHYLFECVGISKIDKEIRLSDYSKYRLIEKVEYDKILSKSKTNPIDFLENQTGSKIGNFKDQTGKIISKNNYQNLKYNPIER